MWYKCNEKKELGLTKAQIARELVLDVKTVPKCLRMSYDELKSSESYKRMYIKLLDEYPDLSSSQIHDWLRERYPDLPDVNSKTVYNFVKYVRAKYNIEKPVPVSTTAVRKNRRDRFWGYAQVDFGEMWMQNENKRKVNVYFFVMVLSLRPQ